ncbi:hypothetical protein QTJ16_004486 [Diplocarpon rosae]|uniref:Uncharacterized protein n=1 Tax=Diplocarpon rosae TaxID=946125 RepID=A0AAD9WER0_9HELO|nr:hypothetical protein QTJ16_004486 [Diplocarpon rosae]
MSSTQFTIYQPDDIITTPPVSHQIQNNSTFHASGPQLCRETHRHSVVRKPLIKRDETAKRHNCTLPPSLIKCASRGADYLIDRPCSQPIP